jgi:glycosyltransferase involved in cell wall biosynthesis
LVACHPAGHVMRVLHVHSGNIFGGVERMLETMAGAAGSPQAPLSSFALCHRGRLAETLVAQHADVYDLGAVKIRRPDQIGHARAKLRKVIADVHPAVVAVHSSWSQAVFGAVAARAGLPLVRWLHSPVAGPRWMELLASRTAPALVICNSRYTCSTTTLFQGAPAEVHYPPARLPAVDGRARETVRAEMGTDADAVIIVMSARLEAWKGHRLLLTALSGLRTSRQWEAWIIGGPQRPEETAYLDALRSQATDSGIGSRIRFVGARDDVPRLLAAADVSCQPNEGPEPFGLSYVEALAAGLPVVSTRLGAAPEILDDTCGVLVDPGASVPLSEALSSLVDDESRRHVMGEAARRRALMFCDPEGSLARLGDLLASVAPA